MEFFEEKEEHVEYMIVKILVKIGEENEQSDKNNINEEIKKAFFYLDEKFFFDKNAKTILSVIRKMTDENIIVTYPTLRLKLHQQNLRKCGELLDYIYIDTPYQPYNFLTFVLLLKEKYLKKKAFEIIKAQADKILSSNGIDVFEFYEETIKLFNNEIDNIIPRQSLKLEEFTDEYIEKHKFVFENNIKSGIPSGIGLYDKISNGFHGGELIILAGRPGMGKSTLANHLAIVPALNKIPVAIFSLEMTKEQVISRIISSITNIEGFKLVNYNLNDIEMQHLLEVRNYIKSLPIYVDDNPNLNILEFKSKANILVKKENVKMIIIDYLQLMNTDKKRNKTRNEEIGELTKEIKKIAKELNIPIIALSQLSRDVEKREDKLPRLSDLRDSGSIEADADIVIFCYRPEYYGMDTYTINNQELNADNLLIMLIEKNRHGKTGEIPVVFEGKYFKISNHPVTLDYIDKDDIFYGFNTTQKDNLNTQTQFLNKNIGTTNELNVLNLDELNKLKDINLTNETPDF